MEEINKVLQQQITKRADLTRQNPLSPNKSKEWIRKSLNMKTPRPNYNGFRLDDSAEFLNGEAINSIDGDSLIRIEKPSFLPSIDNSAF